MNIFIVESQLIIFKILQAAVLVCTFCLPLDEFYLCETTDAALIRTNMAVYMLELLHLL